ncbi:MAG: helix-turn-helix transcriptional regulator [Nostocoides sp.]
MTDQRSVRQPADDIPSFTAREILRQVRQIKGISQAEFGELAGVGQATIAAYESRRRQPTVPTLERLVRAAGLDIAWDIRAARDGDPRLAGPIGLRARELRDQIVEGLAVYGFTRPRVVGAVATGHERWNSGLQLLADHDPDPPTFVEFCRALATFSLQFDCPVTLATPATAHDRGIFDLDDEVPL